jgi:hypothetical protein
MSSEKLIGINSGLDDAASGEIGRAPRQSDHLSGPAYHIPAEKSLGRTRLCW